MTECTAGTCSEWSTAQVVGPSHSILRGRPCYNPCASSRRATPPRVRIAQQYQPTDSARAARIVEQDKRNADVRASSTNRPSSRVLMEKRAADATADEEAADAGLVSFGILVTATVTDPDRLADAVAAVDGLASTARLTLRPVYGSQDSAFAAALPLGLHLPAHLKVPTVVREAL